MSLFAEWWAAYLYGRGLARFYEKRYEDAARLLKKVCDLNPDHERKELYYSYLGRCYLALGQSNDVFDLLSRAYEPFRKRSHMLTEDSEKREYLEFLNAFRDALEKVGQVGRAHEVSQEAERYARTE